jgi:hypothetical protein
MANATKWLGAALLLAALCPVTASAQQGRWDRNRPRREQVSKRKGNQNKPIVQGAKNGTLTRGQPQQPHPESKQIHQQPHPTPAAP